MCTWMSSGPPRVPPRAWGPYRLVVLRTASKYYPRLRYLQLPAGLAKPVPPRLQVYWPPLRVLFLLGAKQKAAAKALGSLSACLCSPLAALWGFTFFSFFEAELSVPQLGSGLLLRRDPAFRSRSLFACHPDLCHLITFQYLLASSFWPYNDSEQQFSSPIPIPHTKRSTCTWH